MTRETFSLDWVNDGDPFEVTPDKLSLGTIEAGQVARKEILENMGEEIEDVPEDLMDLYRGQVVAEMDLAENRILLYRFLSQVDPSLEEMSSREVAERIPVGLMNELGAALKEAREKATPDEETPGIEDPSG